MVLAKVSVTEGQPTKLFPKESLQLHFQPQETSGASRMLYFGVHLVTFFRSSFSTLTDDDVAYVYAKTAIKVLDTILASGAPYLANNIVSILRIK